MGIRLVIYLDDLLILNNSISGLLRDLRIVINLLESLGFIVNYKKSIVVPQQQIEYLGMIIDSEAQKFSLPTDKVVSIVNHCKNILKADESGQVKLRDLSKVMGSFSFTIPSIPYAQGHYRKLQSFFINQSHTHKDLKKTVCFPAGARFDLQWWASNLEHSNGKMFCSLNPDLVIFSDASLQGWGAVCDGSRTRGPWTSVDKLRHINELELLAAFYALQIFTRGSHAISVQMLIDYSTAVAYINKCGGTNSKALSSISAYIIQWCEDRKLSIVASHLPGSLNFIADKESRSALDSSDWMLLATEFKKLQKIWYMGVDLFAAAWSTQLPKFVSWIPQPQAQATNAFFLNWRDLQGYAFPPFALIPRVLAKIRKEEASLVLVCPIWPSQVWFPLLLQQSIDYPRIFAQDLHLIHSPTMEPHPSLRSNKFVLSAWMLSGDGSKIEGFQMRLSSYCWKATVKPRQLLTSRRGMAGLIRTTNGVEIPCYLL